MHIRGAIKKDFGHIEAIRRVAPRLTLARRTRMRAPFVRSENASCRNSTCPAHDHSNIATPNHAHERQNARKYTQKHTQIHTKVHYHTVGCEGSVVPGPQYHHGRSCGRAGHQEEGGVGESGRSTTPTRPPNGRSDRQSSVRVHQRPATDAGPGPAPTRPAQNTTRADDATQLTTKKKAA